MSVNSERLVLRLALYATAPLLVMTGLLCLVLANSVNPMQLAFISTFEVENKTQQPLWITPIGTTLSGDKSVLPQFLPFPVIPVLRSRELRVEPGKRRRIYYDWDDINISEIAIRDSTGVLRCYVIDSSPPTDACYANNRDAYTVDNLQRLPMASATVAAATAPNPRRFVYPIVVVAGIVAPFVFHSLWRRLREPAETQRAELTHGDA
jgi:hypothetical protein